MPQGIHVFSLLIIILVAIRYRLLQLQAQLSQEKPVELPINVTQKASCGPSVSYMFVPAKEFLN